MLDESALDALRAHSREVVAWQDEYSAEAERLKAPFLDSLNEFASKMHAGITPTRQEVIKIESQIQDGLKAWRSLHEPPQTLDTPETILRDVQLWLEVRERNARLPRSAWPQDRSQPSERFLKVREERLDEEHKVRLKTQYKSFRGRLKGLLVDTGFACEALLDEVPSRDDHLAGIEFIAEWLGAVVARLWSGDHVAPVSTRPAASTGPIVATSSPPPPVELPLSDMPFMDGFKPTVDGVQELCPPPMPQPRAPLTRVEMEKVISDGRIVIYKGQILKALEELPTQEELNQPTPLVSPFSSATTEASDEPLHSNPDRTPQKPKPLLFSWTEISDALGWKNTPEFIEKIRRMTKTRKGPIQLPKKGGQPLVDRDELIKWWNELTSNYEQEQLNLEESEKAQEEARKTASESHPYGRAANVSPEVGGSIKSSRRKTNP